jgi:hypothetical protein
LGYRVLSQTTSQALENIKLPNWDNRINTLWDTTKNRI